VATTCSTSGTCRTLARVHTYSRRA
jgi:hypothetical protein